MADGLAKRNDREPGGDEGRAEVGVLHAPPQGAERWLEAADMLDGRPGDAEEGGDHHAWEVPVVVEAAQAEVLEVSGVGEGMAFEAVRYDQGGVEQGHPARWTPGHAVVRREVRRGRRECVVEGGDTIRTI
ncbi:hypothetical protein [Embleya sp. NPDC059237]|uniref:hypothetical protein n=1 Tax=Embleya sp. NPDC059237 TaxID=3346784 RepID=UPI0036CF4CB1